MPEVNQMMLQGYIACARWSSHDTVPTTGIGDEFDFEADTEVQLDAWPGELAEATKKQMELDCIAFRALCEAKCPQELAEYLEKFDESHFGHDFWLTRNGHGVGFWDRSLDSNGELLTKWSGVMGGVDLYIGDGGRIYS